MIFKKLYINQWLVWFMVIETVEEYGTQVIHNMSS
jgi:hypothetical protein